MPRRQVSSDHPPNANRRPLRVARGDPALGVRSLAAILPSVIGKAEALGMLVVAEHLTMALKLAERRADMAERRADR